MSHIIIRVGMAIYLLVLYLFFFRNDSAIRYLLIDSFLAYVPIELFFHLRNQDRKMIRIPLLCFYFLFLPNNAYLLTDLIHLNRVNFYPTNQLVMSENGQDWLMFSISVFGILSLVFLGYQTLNDLVEYWTNRGKISCFTRQWLILLIFFVSSIGVYIGRFGRLNSIDLISRPFAVLKFTLGSAHQESFFFIVIFTVLQYGLYQVFGRRLTK